VTSEHEGIVETSSWQVEQGEDKDEQRVRARPLQGVLAGFLTAALLLATNAFLEWAVLGEALEDASLHSLVSLLLVVKGEVTGG
jgi:hypothetical protein